MRNQILGAALVTALVASALPTFAQSPSSSLGSVTLTKKVMADGQPLAAGTYQLRLTGENAKPAAGQDPDAEAYVEFVKAGKVVAKEVATVVKGTDAESVLKRKGPMTDGVRVETLKGDDYVRVWIAKAGTHYLINLPTGA